MNLGLVAYTDADESEETMDATMDRQMIGSLTNTRLDICFEVNTLSQYMVGSRHVHLIAAKHVMRYLKGTIGLKYVSNCEIILQGYNDSDWAGSVTDWKSTSGCCFSIGINYDVKV
jgi:hypothetical protein